MEYLIEIDTWLFYAFNSGLANPITNWLMPFITNFNNWIPVFVLLFAYLSYDFIKNKNKKSLLIMILLLLAFGLGDYISSSVIKPFLDRTRPCHDLLDVHLLVNCGSGKSLPSTHATNMFALALILFWHKKSWGYFAFPLAFLVAISRIFVGVHYPFDVAAGAVLGIIISSILIYLFNIINKKYKLLD